MTQRFVWIAAAAVTAALFSAPVYLGRGALNDIWNVAFAVALAAAWNILGGQAGQVSFGYASFLGIGAYTTVLLTLRGWNAYATLLPAMLLAAAFSVLVGLPTFRLRGPYFTIATIGIAEAVRVLAAGVSFTGGASGKRMPVQYGDFLYRLLPGLPRGTAMFLENYYAMLLLAVAIICISHAIRRSRFGLALTAIKQDIDAAEALGIDSTAHKVGAHAISAALVALAGSLYAINFQYVSPNSVFAFSMSLQMVLMPVVGGVGTVLGPILGGIVFGYVQIKLLTIPALRSSNLMIYGLLLIAVMLFEPGGMIGMARRLARWLTVRLWRRPAPSAGKEAAHVS